MDRDETDSTRRYDYLLFVGPGRSATTYVYRMLRAHYAVSFPEIKESHYYRDLSRYLGARRRAPDDHILGDVANDAYMDRDLPDALKSLRASGQRVLVVVTLRDHVERAESMVRFDESRGRALRPGGMSDLERRVVARRLTPEQLRRIFSSGVDFAVLDYDALRSDATGVLNRLASLCGIPLSTHQLPQARENPSKRSRSVLLTAAAVLVAKALRGLGLRSTLQRLKDSRRIQGWFFKPLPAEDQLYAGQALSPEHQETLHRANADCWAVVRRYAATDGNGLHIRARPTGRRDQYRSVSGITGLAAIQCKP